MLLVLCCIVALMFTDSQCKITEEIEKNVGKLDISISCNLQKFCY